MKDEHGNYFFNDMLPKLELMNFKIEKQIYRSGVQIIKNYTTNNILIAERKFEKLENTIKKEFESYVDKRSFIIPNATLKKAKSHYENGKLTIKLPKETNQVAQSNTIAIE